MSATEELRRMLDERGVEWSDHSDDSVLHTEWDRYRCWFNEYPDGWTAWGKCAQGTPAEAIEATLGRGTCEMEDSWYGEAEIVEYRCSSCGGYAIVEAVHPSLAQKPCYCPKCGRKVMCE